MSDRDLLHPSNISDVTDVSQFVDGICGYYQRLCEQIARSRCGFRSHRLDPTGKAPKARADNSLGLRPAAAGRSPSDPLNKPTSAECALESRRRTRELNPKGNVFFCPHLRRSLAYKAGFLGLRFASAQAPKSGRANLSPTLARISHGPVRNAL